MSAFRDILRDDGGFSVAELVVAAAIGLLVLGGAYLIFEASMVAFSQVEGTTISTRQAAQSMARVQRALREGTNITIAEDYEIQFMSDPDDDGKPERVRFFIPAGTRRLMLESADVTASAFVTTTPVGGLEIANTVRNRVDGQPLFRYYTRKQTQLGGTQRLNAGVVRLFFITQANTVKPTPLYRVQTDVFLRNSGT